MTVTPTPYSTPYEYVGDIPGLGSLELTYLANSYAELDTTTLEEFFPDENIIPRTITIETTKTSLGLMRMVDMGMQDTASMANDRIERRTLEPAVFRESDFLDHGFINQIRDYGTDNENSAVPISRLIQERIQKLVAKRNRTIDFFRSQVLLGGIDYTDPYTKSKCNVSTQIPEHNFMHYQGYFEDANKGDIVSEKHDLRAYADLDNDKGRPEALLFQSTDGEAGVPWTHPRADIMKSLRLIQHYLLNTNKNRYTDIVMSHDLLTVIMENELIKAYQGQYGFFNFETSNGTQGQNISYPGAAPPMIGFSSGGMMSSIAGLNIITMDSLYLDPYTNEHVKMWPTNKVVLVARNYMRDSSQTLGKTVHPVAEGPNQQPGLWIWSSDLDYNPPHPPGRAIQIGDAFLPFAVYPEWISVLTVCEEDDVFANTILRSDIDFNLAF